MSGEAARFFDTIAGRYDRVYAIAPSESRVRMQRVVAELPPPPSRILDLGVGTGRELTALLDAGHRPTGLDASQAMLDRCARRARPVPLVHADFWSASAPLPFDDGAFDAAVALHGTLAHAPDDESLARLARDLGRVVRSGGRFVGEVPSLAWLEAVAAQPLAPEQRVTRTGERTFLYEDLVAGASIGGRLFDEASWRSAFAPAWRLDTRPLGVHEWLLLAERV